MYHLISIRQNVTHGLRVFIKVIGVPLIGYVLFLGYQDWQDSQLPPPVESPALSTGEEGEESPRGVLYFSAVPKDQDVSTVFPNVYRYRFPERATSQLFPYPAFAYNHISAAYAAVMGPFADTEDPDDVQPLWYSPEQEILGPLPGMNQYNEQELVTSPDNIHYAYSYQEAADADPYSLLDWSIALHNFETGEVVTIPVAAEPHFFNEGADMAFMRPDGVYRYNLQTGEITILYGTYADMTMVDDYAISPDSSTLILAAPSIHTVSIARFNPGTQQFEESSVHFDPDYRYRHPVVAPNQELYAVTVVEDASFDEALGQYTRGGIEIRRLSDRALVDTLEVENFVPSVVQLDQWLAE